MTSEDEEFPRDLLEEWTVPEMPSDMKERVMAQLHEQWNMGVPTHAYGAPPKKSAAAIAALLAAGAALAASTAAVFVSMRADEAPPPIAVAAEPVGVASDPLPGTPVPMIAVPPREPRGQLTIAVTPPDAIVELDGVALPGPSPFVATDLSVGAHEVRVRREGHVDWTRVIQVPDTQLHLPILLTPASAEATAAAEEVPLEPSGLLEKVAEPSSKDAKTPVPSVRQAKAEVHGAMDKDIIRRIVRAHINEVRLCYNQGLARDPSLHGRVVVQFTINANGKVPVAVVQESTLSDNAVGQCIAKAVKRWSFPKPDGGGNVVVTYPFVLEAD